MVKRIFCMVALVAGMLPATSGAQGLEAGNAAATAIGVQRVASNRHHW